MKHETSLLVNNTVEEGLEDVFEFGNDGAGLAVCFLGGVRNINVLNMSRERWWVKLSLN